MTPTPPDVRFGQPSSGARTSPSFGLAGGVAGIAAIAALVGGMVWSAAAGRSVSAQHPDLFGGSLVLQDDRPLTVIDVATAKVTVRLPGIFAQVGATSYGDVEAVPVDEGTMLVNRATGTFNLLQNDDYVLDSAGAGVGLGPLRGLAGATALAAGSDAYVIRSSPDSTVSLVGAQTVSAAAKLEALGSAVSSHSLVSVAPLGFAAVGGPVARAAGAAAVSGSDLWVLAGMRSARPGASPGGCAVTQLRPSSSNRQGLALSAHGTLPVPCASAAVEGIAGLVAVASPGEVTLYSPGGRAQGRSFAVPDTAGAGQFLPVSGAPVSGSTASFWFMARSTAGWAVLGVSRSGRVTGPSPLAELGSLSEPAEPASSGGYLYTLDQAATGQPTLWQIDPASGRMAPVVGAATYPARSANERVGFGGAQVIVDGPRVVFNNPASLEAVVVFTDGSHAPVVVDKSDAVEISATGPADLSAQPGSTGRAKAPAAQSRPVPVVVPVSQKITCASTTQKPYSPQVTSVAPSSGAALVAWSYQLLDQADCEPDSWSVHVTALSGSHQPARPVQVATGQQQYLFTGLRPATTYQAVVTAYINQQSTPSLPVTFVTQPRGPDAPLSVSAASDGHGDWVVSWSPCSEAVNPNCVVGADVWNVVGAACGSSFVGQPPSVPVPGNQNSVTIDSDKLGLLGESLTFTVQGALASGLTGNPTSDHECTEAWRHPDPSLITLAGAGAQSGQTITATLEVATAGSPIEAFGSRSTQFVYRIGSRTSRYTTIGPTTATRVSFPGLAPNQAYTPSVTIYPTGQPGGAVTIDGAAFSHTLAWPADLAIGVKSASVDSSDPNSGSVAFTANVPSGPMEAVGTYTCASTQSQQFTWPISDGQFTVPFDLVHSGGSCTLDAVVDDTAKPDPYGLASATLTTPFEIGQQPAYRFSGEFTPACQQSPCEPEQLEVDYDGTGTLAAGDGWSISVASGSNGQADPCAVSKDLSTPPSFPQTIDLPLTCPFGLESKVDVTVTYTYLGTTTNADAGEPQGNPPATTTTTTTTTVPSPGPRSTDVTVGSAVGWGAVAVGGGWAAATSRKRRTRIRDNGSGE